MGSHPDAADPTQAVDGLVRAIRDLTSDPNYKLVADVFSEFLYVKEQNNKLSSSHQVVLEEYRKFRNELEAQKEELNKEKKDLEALVQEKVQEIMQLTATRARLETDLDDAHRLLEETKARAAEAADTAAKEYATLQGAKAAVEDEKRRAEKAAAGEIAALTQAKTTLEGVKAGNEAEIKTLEGAIAGLQKAKADNEAQVASLKEAMAKLEGEKARLEGELDDARKQMAALKQAIADKNKEIESLQESLRAAEEQIASLQQTIEDKNAEIEDLHGKLRAEGTRADKAEEHGRNLQKTLEETNQTLKLTAGKLAHLEQFRVPLNTDNDDTYVSVLDKIWTTIVTLVESTFRPDLDETILADPSCWTNLRNSPYLKHATQLQIPLPQSNSPAAKGMRISAVLAILSRALHKHLFRPLYLLDDDDENLVRFLRALEDEDPTREAHLRATLLAMMPDRQAEMGARKIKMVVREVSWVVQHLLSALQFEAFCTGLEQACRLAYEQWCVIQRAQMKIEPYFGPPYDDFDWQVLELPEFAEAAEREACMPSLPHAKDDAAASVAGDKNGGDAASFHDGASSHHPAEDDLMEGEIDPDEILLVVWPSMCAVEGGELMSITQGLVISKEQARPALEEQRSRSRMIPRPGSRRARTMSMPGQSRVGSPARSLGKSHFFGPSPSEVNADGPDY
ncbi:hypothetical protein VTJ83DRAFT_5157 [Remersonia thermophila]|uniref:Mei5 protein n=1 Tax=Remersonia thermophila TaxID=72144 RepID=A0ABR4DC13_9PEZI